MGGLVCCLHAKKEHKLNRVSFVRYGSCVDTIREYESDVHQAFAFHASDPLCSSCLFVQLLHAARPQLVCVRRGMEEMGFEFYVPKATDVVRVEVLPLMRLEAASCTLCRHTGRTAYAHSRRLTTRPAGNGSASCVWAHGRPTRIPFD